MQYLILHKVRGEPAFDIAEKLQIGDEEGWIIPTSGHRAYPIQTWDLGQLIYAYQGSMPNKLIPGNWPDHYQSVDLPARKGQGLKIDMGKILANLLPKINRRV